MSFLSFLTKKPNDPDTEVGDSEKVREKSAGKPKKPGRKEKKKKSKAPIAELDYAPDLPAGTPHHVVYYRGWFREQYKRTVLICLLLLMVLCVSIAGNIYLYLSEQPPVYYAATSDFRLAKLTPLDQPLMSQTALLNWTAETVAETLSLDFLNWRKKLMRIRPRYSSEAFAQLLESLKASGNLDMIRRKRLSVSATTSQPPIIVGKGALQGRIVWRIEVPVQATYEDSNATQETQNLIAAVVVERVSTLEKPTGIQVRQLLLKSDGR